jgi:uncharacterized protein (TIGR02466 family)
MPSATVRELFPTLVHVAPLRRGGARALNARLLRECEQLRHDDVAGQRWSARSYPGGYTSYGSLCRLHTMTDGFATLAKLIDRHVLRYAQALDLDLEGRKLAMTDCWINIMGRHAVHGLHLHPVSTISGTYYLRTPVGAPGLKFEDPRLDRFMAAPPRRGSGSWITIPARAGQLVLFESWLRHEVPMQRSDAERVSVSFNYHWS